MRTIRELETAQYITRDEMVEYCIVRTDLVVVKFHDTRTDLRWFQRQVTELGQISTLMYDGEPLNRAELLAFARREFGNDCAVLW